MPKSAPFQLHNLAEARKGSWAKMEAFGKVYVVGELLGQSA